MALRPKRFVLLVSVQQVKLFRSAFNRGLYGQPHGDEADTVRGITGVKTGLVKVELFPIRETIEGGGFLAVERQNEKAKPTLSEGQARQRLMKTN